MTEQATYAYSYLRCLPETMTLLEMEVSELKQLILSCPDEFTIIILRLKLRICSTSTWNLRLKCQKWKRTRYREKVHEKHPRVKRKAESTDCNVFTAEKQGKWISQQQLHSSLQLHHEVTSHSSTPPDTVNGHVKERTHTPPPPPQNTSDSGLSSSSDELNWKEHWTQETLPQTVDSSAPLQKYKMCSWTPH